MSFIVNQLSKFEWEGCAEKAHLIVFGEERHFMMNRIDFALTVKTGDKHIGYLTAKEMDSETLYWQYGGALPDCSPGEIVPSYIAFVDWSLERYKRITTKIENTNIKMLHLAMKMGFLIVGTWNFDGKIYLELLNERKNQ